MSRCDPHVDRNGACFIPSTTLAGRLCATSSHLQRISDFGTLSRFLLADLATHAGMRIGQSFRSSQSSPRPFNGPLTSLMYSLQRTPYPWVVRCRPSLRGCQSKPLFSAPSDLRSGWMSDAREVSLELLLIPSRIVQDRLPQINTLDFPFALPLLALLAPFRRELIHHIDILLGHLLLPLVAQVDRHDRLAHGRRGDEDNRERAVSRGIGR